MFAKMQERYLAPRKSRALRRLEVLSAPIDPTIEILHSVEVNQRLAVAGQIEDASRVERKLAEVIKAHESFQADPVQQTELVNLQQAYSDKVAKRAERLARMKARTAKFVAFLKSVGGAVKKAASFVAKTTFVTAGTVVGTALFIPVIVVVGAGRLAWLLVRHIGRLLWVDLRTIKDVAILLWEVASGIVLSPLAVWRLMVWSYDNNGVIGWFIANSAKRKAQMEMIADYKDAQAAAAPEVVLVDGEPVDVSGWGVIPEPLPTKATEGPVTPPVPEVAPEATPAPAEPTVAPVAPAKAAPKPRRTRAVRKPRAA